MKPSFRLWVVTDKPEIAIRWRPVLETEGWPFVFVRSLEKLIGDVPNVQSGFALIDVERLDHAGPPMLSAFKTLAIPYLLFGPPELDDGKVIRLLEAGADDYLHETMDGRLLAARLKAHLRRLLPALSQEMEVLWSPGRQLKCDQRQRQAWMRSAQGQWERLSGLTDTEFRLLCLFLRNPEAALERRFILEALWGERACEVYPQTVDRHIESLRHKLGLLGAKIKTLYGLGYAFREKN